MSKHTEKLQRLGEFRINQWLALGVALGGPEQVEELLRCKQITVTFGAGDSDKHATVAAETSEVKVRKTIRIGTGIKSDKEFCACLEQNEFRTGDWARDMMKQEAFTVATEETEVDLVNLSVADLGFKEGARYDAICARAFELDLELCPAEVGPQLRLQYPDQPCGEWLIIAMEAIRDSGGGLRVFRVGRDGSGRWLGSDCGESDDFYGAGPRFVFRFPRK